MSRGPAYADNESEFARLDDEASSDDIRYRAARARSEDEYLETLRGAGNLSAGLRIMAAADPHFWDESVRTHGLPPVRVDQLSTAALEQYERLPQDPVLRTRYVADEIVIAALAELARRRKEQT